MENDTTDSKLFARFEKYQEFLDTQQALLSFDLLKKQTEEDKSREWSIARKLRDTLDEYQEQAYLLDPFLDSLVTPVVNTLRNHVKAFVEARQTPEDSERLNMVANHMYQYIKFRGYKTITRFFPHEISDLSIALEYMLLPESPALVRHHWPIRYVVLLWLSLVCMIPFDLEKFDGNDRAGETAERMESLGKQYLNSAGLEREGAAILLARLFMRKDTSVRLPAFVLWSTEVVAGPTEPFLTMGLLQVLCEVTNSGSAEQVRKCAPAFLDVAYAVQDNKSLLNNTLTRKLRTKLVSRVVLRLLPAAPIVSRSKGRALTGSMTAGEGGNVEELDFDVPEEAESVLEDLFSALQDKDTLVRWSAAKGVGRISERLPSDFARQVLDNVVSLYSIHSIAGATIYDMPSIAEGTWHGACLACAEMARRGLVADDVLPEVIEWQCKALYFDIRKGAHSIGSNVRDAACYVLWSLARSQRPAMLALFVDDLSRKLVAASLFDREIHIRRAASATFQEFVGRTSLFMHGIEVLRKTDFYAVGIRRNAFLVAAPEVAEHIEYRPYLIDHLLSVTLRHWDPQMRQLGAQSLRVICELDLPSLGPDVATRASQFLKGPDVSDIHGALAVLTELAAAYRDSKYDLDTERKKVFTYLVQVPLNIIESPRHELVTAAACNIIANGISAEEISSDETSVPHWRQVVDISLKSKSTPVQEAAAGAMAAVSKLVDCSAVVQRLIRDFRSGSPPMQQSLCRVLGVLDYAAYPHGILTAIGCLLDAVDRSDSSKTMNVEARRNAFTSLPQILSSVASRLVERLSPVVVLQMIDAMEYGLTDYTSDERGDVGSWARMACVQGLTASAKIMFPMAGDLSPFAEFFPPSKYHDAIGGILKQGVERLDNVRQIAGECFLRLLVTPLPSVDNKDEWRIHGEDLLKNLFIDNVEAVGWNEGDTLFPKAVRLLEIERYRPQVLAGLVLSASTKTDSTQRPVTASLVAYARTLPINASETKVYDQCSLAQDLVSQASRNITSNNVVVPVLQTFDVLLESDVFEQLSGDPAGLQSLRALLSIASRNVARLKSHQRIVMCMRVVVSLLSMAALRGECVAQLPSFLAHQYPTIRSDTAEYLYLVLQTKDMGFETDELEEVVLETEWSSNDTSAVEEAARRCVDILSGGS